MFATVEKPETLVIDQVAAKNNRLVWRGPAPETLVDEYQKSLKKIN
jgi:hypothetical protein